jgi:sugar transferase (PEP-CTERM/EpsH1 system associated)
MDSLGNGGLENGVMNLIHHLDAAQFEHCVCTTRALGPNAERLPSRVRRLHLGEGDRSRFQVAKLMRVIRQVRPDVVHSRNWGTIEAVIAARLQGCKIVHSEHGLETGADAREPWRRVAFRRLAYHLSDRVLCVSRQLRDFHARSTGFPARRMTVVHNGVDSRRFGPDPAGRARMRHELGIREDEFCLGCVGNLLPVKDHATLLKALGRLGELVRGWHLMVAGEGPERPRLEAAAAGLSSRMRISFLGRSTRVPEMLNAFDVYVLPSVNEGISNSLLEAMATGLPVIAGDVGGNPEVVEDRVSGLLFPRGDAACLGSQLELLSSQGAMREELGAAARRRVREMFSIDSMAQSYERLYRGLTSGALHMRAEAQA